MFKALTALTLLALFYAAQNPKAIENMAREKEIYDSVSKYCCHASKEEMEFIYKLRQDEKRDNKGNIKKY